MSTRSSRVELLAGVPLFKGLSAEELESIEAASREEEFPAGHDIVQIGDAGHSLYLIRKGTVQVLYPARSNDFELARLSVGDFFGEMALLNNMPRSATVRTLDEVGVLVLEQGVFQKVLLDSPLVGVKILEILSVRIRNADEQISGLSDKAMRDPLTGLLNRRAFHERLQEETDRARRYGDHFSVIILDVDHFKSVNDTFGYDVGDVLLSWIGRILNEHTRAVDTPFRIGGEEFALLAPATGAEVAAGVARRIVEVVAEARPPVSFELKVTLSAGFASCPEFGSHADRLFNVADQAVLRAKSAGRNRVAEPKL